MSTNYTTRYGRISKPVSKYGASQPQTTQTTLSEGTAPRNDHEASQRDVISVGERSEFGSGTQSVHETDQHQIPGEREPISDDDAIVLYSPHADRSANIARGARPDPSPAQRRLERDGGSLLLHDDHEDEDEVRNPAE